MVKGPTYRYCPLWDLARVALVQNRNPTQNVSTRSRCLPLYKEDFILLNFRYEIAKILGIFSPPLKSLHSCHKISNICFGGLGLGYPTLEVE